MMERTITTAPAEPEKTRFEVFNARDGVLRMKEFFKLTPPLLKYGKAEAVLVRSRDTQTYETRVALNVKFQGAERERSVYLDEDEIASLAGALAYMQDNHAALIDMTKTYTELTYTSRGGFTAGFYVTEEKTTEGYMVIEGETAFLHSLGELCRMVDEGLFKNEIIRGG